MKELFEKVQHTLILSYLKDIGLFTFPNVTCVLYFSMLKLHGHNLGSFGPGKKMQAICYLQFAVLQ